MNDNDVKQMVMLFTSDGEIHFAHKDEDYLERIQACDPDALSLHQNRKIVQVLNAGDCWEHKVLVMVTQQGFAVRISTTALRDIIMGGGKSVTAMRLFFDSVVGVFFTDGGERIAIFTSDGLVSVISEEDIALAEALVSEVGEDGVPCIRLGQELEEHNLVVAASGISDNDETLFVFTERGYIKRIRPTDILMADTPSASSGHPCVELTEETGCVVDGTALASGVSFLMQSSAGRTFVVNTKDIPIMTLSEEAVDWYHLNENERVDILSLLPMD